MEQCIDSYKNCLGTCVAPNSKSSVPNCICKYVCQDKFRTCLGDVAKKYGNNNLWPYQNANYGYHPYLNINDMDNSFRTPPKNSPFSLPDNYISGGPVGEYNRTRPYQLVYGREYGGLLKYTRPATRDPIYY